MAKKRKGIVRRVASAARARIGRALGAAGTPDRDVPPPTDFPTVQGNDRASEREVARATTEPTSSRTTKKTAPSRGRVMIDEFDHPVSSGGYKGAARKAPGGPPRGGKR